MSADILNFDSLLDTHIDEIPDLPKFALFPTTMLRLRGVSAEIQRPENKPPKLALIAEFLGFPDPSDVKDEELERLGINRKEDGSIDIVEGSLLSITFSDAKGVQRFKEVFADVIKGLGLTTPSQMLDQFEGTEFVALNKPRGVKDEVTNENRYFNGVQVAVPV